VLACQQGRRVRFTTLAAFANELQAAETRRELGRVIARYARIELVCLDELGYLALPAGAAELVFQVISERNERASMIVTTNLPFGEWTKVFPDARLAKPSSTGSPTEPTSSIPATRAGGSATASPDTARKEPDPQAPTTTGIGLRSSLRHRSAAARGRGYSGSAWSRRGAGAGE
jgi:hypothetical protein